MKTTISVHLAAWLLVHGCKVLLVDGDPQRLAYRWMRAALPELEVILITDPDEILQRLPALSKEYDVVVVDSPGGMNSTTGAILHVADDALIPTGASYLDLEGSEWTVETIKHIQKQRDGLPRTGLIAANIEEGQSHQQNLEEIARSISFGFIKSSIPHKAILAQARGVRQKGGKEWKSPPSLVWQMGRNQKVREAALPIDDVFQEIYGGACQDDPNRILRLVTTKSKYKQLMEEYHEEQLTANG